MSLNDKLLILAMMVSMMQMIRLFGARWAGKQKPGEPEWPVESDPEMANPREVRQFFVPLMMLEFTQLAGMVYAIIERETIFGTGAAIIAILFFATLYPQPVEKGRG